MALIEQGRSRVIIEGVSPEIDCGRHPVKRVKGDAVVVEADIFTDGHDAISAALLWRREDTPSWTETPLMALGNDRWRGEFAVADEGRYCYSLIAWIDRFGTWARDFAKRVAAGQDVAVDLQIGAELVEAAAGRATAVPEDAARLQRLAGALRAGGGEGSEQAQSPELALLMTRYPDRRFARSYEKELGVVVDRERAGFSSWYEFFPRSTSSNSEGHGTFKDAEAWLPEIAAMGFDVVYLPPIHPIGQAYRKGPNNTLTPSPSDPGSPWAIGAAEGGHTAVHPELGTLEDFRHFVDAARALGIEIALDIAFQVAPDHPYVTEHPQWFRHRPDGTIQYAENPPKKYQDIYPFDFESEDWQALWAELRDVVRFWVGQGVQIFRVDNPHTKPLPFWEWLITEVKREHPSVLFLAEAFTRPRVMYHLAKAGFSQSYTYFAWRNTSQELTEYLTELTRTEVREFYRPSFWPNTPDILTEYLQLGGRPAFMARLVLAATLSSNYGIYGPAFELAEGRPREHGSEEYLDSEKYEVKRWDRNAPHSLRPFITRVNAIRRDNPALHRNDRLRFHPVDNDRLICYSKTTADLSNIIVVAVNLDPHNRQSGWVQLPIEELGLEADHPYQVHDLLGDARFLWHGPRNYLDINPHVAPAHIFRIRRRTRTEQDFEYFM